MRNRRRRTEMISQDVDRLIKVRAAQHSLLVEMKRIQTAGLPTRISASLTCTSTVNSDCHIIDAKSPPARNASGAPVQSFSARFGCPCCIMRETRAISLDFEDLPIFEHDEPSVSVISCSTPKLFTGSVMTMLSDTEWLTLARWRARPIMDVACDLQTSML